MTNERMLELLLLDNISEGMNTNGPNTYKGIPFDYEKYCKRMEELVDELVEPYLIHTNSKEN